MNTKGDLIFLLKILADRDVSHPNEIFPDFFSRFLEVNICVKFEEEIFFQIFFLNFRGKIMGKILEGKILPDFFLQNSGILRGNYRLCAPAGGWGRR